MDQLIEYLSTNYASFYNLLTQISEDLEFFQNRSLYKGFTLLIPQQKYLAHLTNIYKSSPASALEEIYNLILIPRLSINDWEKNQVSNINGFVVTTKSVSSDGIVVIDDTYNTTLDFVEMLPLVSIYNVVKGKMVQGNTRIKVKKEVKIESSEPKVQKTRSGSDIRVMIYNQSLKTNANEMLNFVGSFLYFVKINNTQLYSAIGPFLDFNPIVSFFILFEPTKNKLYFIDDEVIRKWGGVNNYPIDPRKELVDAVLYNKTGICYTNTQEYLRAVSEIRDHILDVSTSMPSAVSLAYNDMVFNNKISDVGGILPKEAFEYIKSRSSRNYNIKLMQDEFRAIVAESDESYVELLDNLKTSLKVRPFFNDSESMGAYTRNIQIATLSTFINSTYFLYVAPMSPKFFNIKKKSYSTIDINELGDHTQISIDELRSYQITKNNFTDVLDTLDNDNIPDEVVTKIKKIASRFNQKRDDN